MPDAFPETFGQDAEIWKYIEHRTAPILWDVSIWRDDEGGHTLGSLDVADRRRIGEHVVAGALDYLNQPGKNSEVVERRGHPILASEVEEACRVMHDAYEAAAVTEGWETQERSRKPWSDVPEANKATMRAAVTALLESNVMVEREQAAALWAVDTTVSEISQWVTRLDTHDVAERIRARIKDPGQWLPRGDDG